MNLYDVLGVPKDATQKEIKQAYKREAQKAHPDRPGGDEERIRELNEAYAILGNEKSREHYDRTGTTEAEPSLEDLAYHLLAQLIHKQVASESFSGNLVHELIFVLNKRYMSSQRKIHEAKEKMGKLRKQLGRIQNRKGDNLYEGALKCLINDLMAAQEQEQKHSQVLEKAIELAENHEDTRPEAKEQPTDSLVEALRKNSSFFNFHTP